MRTAGAGAETSTARTERCLERIAARDPVLRAFITVTADTALEAAREADAMTRSGDVARSSPRRAGCREGLHRCWRRSLHIRFGVLLRSRAGAGRERRQPAEGGRRHPPWQDQPSRVRLRRHQPERLLRRLPQSLGHAADPRWLERRFGRRRRRRPRGRRSRERHRLVDPHAGGPHRRQRTAADPWPRFGGRRISRQSAPRHGRADCPQRRRSRAPRRR